MMSSAKDLDDGQKTIYDEHLSPAHVSNGIKSGKYLQGKLGISSHNYLEVKQPIQAPKETKNYSMANQNNCSNTSRSLIPLENI